MLNRAIVLLAALACAACSNSVAVQQDEEIVSSIRYDEVPCDQLTAQRNALADAQGLPRDTRREPMDERSPMVGLVMPDMRAEATRQREQAIGLLSAMNQSMERRKCGQEA